MTDIENRTVRGRVARRVAKKAEGNHVGKCGTQAIWRHGGAIAVGMAHDRTPHGVEEVDRGRRTSRWIRIHQSAVLRGRTVFGSVAKELCVRGAVLRAPGVR